MAASRPIWCSFENKFILWRRKENIKKIVPTSTWSPWKPVAKKNVAPKTESEKLYEVSVYSHPWINVK